MIDSHAIQTTPSPAGFVDRLVVSVKGWERTVLMAGIGFQLVALSCMTAVRTYALKRSDVYFVRVVPVDPRDLLRGDYVILGYSFSRLPSEYYGNPMVKPGRNVYVELVPEGDGKHWRAGGYNFSPPVRGPYLRGKLIDRGRIEYGIESFFVQEGKGRRYEQAIRTRQLTAEIGIAPDGQAVVRDLHIGF